MNVAAPLQWLISQPPVGVDHASGFNRLLHEGNQAVGRSVRNAPHPNPPNPFAVLLCRHCNQRLALGLPTARTLFQPSQIGFVHLHDPRESFPPGPYHGPPQFVQTHPSRLVATQAQNSLQSQGADPILLTRHPPHRPEPNRQRCPGALKNCSRRYRNLMSAPGALETPGSQRPSFALPAAPTPKPLRPSQAEQILPARFLATESSFELRQSPRIIFHRPFHGPPHYL